MNLRQTYHITSTARRCSAGSDWWGRHRYKGSWWGEGSTYPIATPIWPKRGYASATASANAKLVLELEWVWGAKVVPPSSIIHILVILVVTTSRIWATPPVIITYIEDKLSYKFAIKLYYKFSHLLK